MEAVTVALGLATAVAVPTLILFKDPSLNIFLSLEFFAKKITSNNILKLLDYCRNVDEKLEQSSNILNQLNEAIYFGVNLIINLDVS